MAFTELKGTVKDVLDSPFLSILALRVARCGQRTFRRAAQDGRATRAIAEPTHPSRSRRERALRRRVDGRRGIADAARPPRESDQSY